MFNSLKNRSIPVATLVVGFVIGASALTVLANWTNAPAGNPPGNCDGPPPIEGCNPPVTTSSNSQVKTGNLTVNSLGAAGLTLKPAGISPSVGQVLTTTDTNGTGAVSWGWVSPYAGSYTFKRVGPFTGDAVAWCPTDFPYYISASTADDQAGGSGGLNGLADPCPTNNDGPCDMSDPTFGRTGLGTNHMYLEVVKRSVGGIITWGVLEYDAGHAHNAYKIDLVCSK